MFDRKDIAGRAAEYRRNADDCEEAARTTSWPYLREQLRDLATQWRDLADRVESLIHHY